MLKVSVYYIIFQYLYLVVFIFVWLNDKQFCKIVFIYRKIFEKYFIKYMYKY